MPGSAANGAEKLRLVLAGHDAWLKVIRLRLAQRPG
jgi:hypothetical protein